jgi:PTH1 family peptidyl-tRNA hydrolase
MDKNYHGLVARATVHGNTIWLLQPQTFMNLSGKSVAALARFFKIAPHEILVAHDELDISPGQVKLKFGGSHAGHNGLRDIHAQLGSATTGDCVWASDIREPKARSSTGSSKSPRKMTASPLHSPLTALTKPCRHSSQAICKRQRLLIHTSKPARAHTPAPVTEQPN